MCFFNWKVSHLIIFWCLVGCLYLFFVRVSCCVCLSPVCFALDFFVDVGVLNSHPTPSAHMSQKVEKPTLKRRLSSPPIDSIRRWIFSTFLLLLCLMFLGIIYRRNKSSLSQCLLLCMATRCSMRLQQCWSIHRWVVHCQTSRLQA